MKRVEGGSVKSDSSIFECSLMKRRWLLSKESVIDHPSLGATGCDVYLDIRFRTDCLWSRPEVREIDGRVRCLLHADAEVFVFEGKVVVGDFSGVSGEIALHAAAFERCDKLNRVVFDDGFGRIDGAIKDWSKREADLHARPGLLMIQHEEVVVVDLCIDRLCPDVLESVFQTEDVAVFVECEHLLVDV